MTGPNPIVERLASADDGLSITYTLTRERPPGWTGFTRRVDAEMLEVVGPAAAAAPRAFGGAEVTGAVRGCGSCGQSHAVGRHRLYRGAGLVLRCPGCGDVAMVLVEREDRREVQLVGRWRLSVPV